MKTYQNESQFVNNFAKDCKEGIKENGKFEAVWDNVTITVTSMDNNNASKCTMYAGTIDGVSFTGNITALKKRLHIAYTKEYNRNSEASTRVTIKSDSELSETAKVAAKRIKDAFEILYKASQKYGLSRAEMLERTESVETLILETLKQQRDRVAKERADKEAQQAKEAAKREEQKATLLAKIQEASANGNFDLVITLSNELKKLTK